MTIAVVPSQTQQPIDVKRAVVIARGYVALLYEADHIFDVSLEEVEHDAGYWYITIGFSQNNRQVEAQPDLPGLPDFAPERTVIKTRRLYKVVKVDENTGVPISMKIRSDECSKGFTM